MDFADRLDMMDDDCDIEGFPLEQINKRKIRAYFFKQSGKYYTEEIIEVPEKLQVWEICDGIKDCSLYSGYKGMPYIMIDASDGNDHLMYPCLIIR